MALFALWSDVKKEAQKQVDTQVEAALKKRQPQLDKDIAEQVKTAVEVGRADFEKKRNDVSAKWDAEALLTESRVKIILAQMTDVEAKLSEVAAIMKDAEGKTTEAKKILDGAVEARDKFYPNLAELDVKREKFAKDLEVHQRRVTAYSETVDALEKRDLQGSIDKAEKFLKAIEGLDPREIPVKLKSLGESYAKLAAQLKELDGSAIKTGMPIHIISRRGGNEALANFQSGGIPVRTTPRQVAKAGAEANGSQDWELRQPTQ